MTLCKYFRKNVCKKGDKCPFKHTICKYDPVCVIKKCKFGHTKYYHESSFLLPPSVDKLNKQIPIPKKLLALSTSR